MWDGPGTELMSTLHSLGITQTDDCGCGAKAAQMNAWGTAGCREHFEEIVQWLRDGSDKFKWPAKLKAAANAVTSGLLGELRDTGLFTDWTDPFPALVELAIRRAEAKADALPT